MADEQYAMKSNQTNAQKELAEWDQIVIADKNHSRQCRLRDTGWWWAILYPTNAGLWHMFTRKTLTPIAFGLGTIVFITLSIGFYNQAFKFCKEEDRLCMTTIGFIAIFSYIPGAKAGIEWDRRRAIRYFSSQQKSD